MTDAERRALNVEVAEKVMGYQWHQIKYRLRHLCPPGSHQALIIERNGEQILIGYPKPNMPDFAGDPSAAYAMEEAIPEGKRHAYVEALTVIVEGAQRLNAWQTGWALIHATPAQRARAAVRAMESR